MSEKKELGFEAALSRLEEVVDQMEGGSLSLEQMIAHFEEGSALVGNCNARLNEVERRIEKLVRKSSGELDTEPFAEPEA
jgi:exodeoxyribonuclease VII small subunit